MNSINYSHLRLLAIFSTVVEVGSFAAAARKLSSSRSRISEQVAQLEADLGVRLLQRSTRQLTTTHEGQQVYQQARQLPNILQDIEAITTPPEPAGRVAITMNHDIAHKYILPVLADFQALYPQVQLDLILDDSRVDLINEQVDLAIRIGIPKDDSLIARIMHEERFILCASPSYLEENATPKSIKDLEKLRWITLSQKGQQDIQYLQKKGKSIEVPLTDFYRCNSPLMIQQMTIKGLGISLLLPSTVKEALNTGDLIQIMPSISSDLMVFSLVYPSRRQVPLRTRVLIDFLLAAKIFD